MDQPAEVTVIEDSQIDHLRRWAKNGTKPLTQLWRDRLKNALEELKRHRKIEHDQYWGMDDD